MRMNTGGFHWLNLGMNKVPSPPSWKPQGPQVQAKKSSSSLSHSSGSWSDSILRGMNTHRLGLKPGCQLSAGSTVLHSVIFNKGQALQRCSPNTVNHLQLCLDKKEPALKPEVPKHHSTKIEEVASVLRDPWGQIPRGAPLQVHLLAEDLDKSAQGEAGLLSSPTQPPPCSQLLVSQLHGHFFEPQSSQA